MERKFLSDLIYITRLLCSRKEGVLRPWSKHFVCSFPGKYIDWGFMIKFLIPCIGCLMLNTAKLNGKIEEGAGAWQHLKIAQDQN